MADEASAQTEKKLAVASGVDTPGGPATGTVTPALSELPPDQVKYSLKVSLADLSAKATALYAHKKYDEAAEVYARAAEMQAEINGEESTENAEILFLYGRCLFQVGQSKSNVLGGMAPDTKTGDKAGKKSGGKKKVGTNGEGSSKAPEGVIQSAAAVTGEAVEKAEKVVEEAAEKVAEVVAEKVAEVAENVAEKEAPVSGEATKPLFQFTGDENWDDSDEEQEVRWWQPTASSARRPLCKQG